MRKVCCLLTSALPRGDLDNGDPQYARDLLADPPAGVTYAPSPDAFASGELAEDASWRRGGTHSSGGSPPIVITDSAGTLWHWTRVIGVREEEARRRLRWEGRMASARGYVYPSVCPDDAAEPLYFVKVGVCLVAWPQQPDPRLLGGEWLGPLARDELHAEVHSVVDVFLYPTRADAAPLVVVETLARGGPVIALANLGSPEMVIDGRSGLLFAEGDVAQATKLTLRVLSDPGLKHRLSEGAREEFVSRLSAAVRNQRLLDAYLGATA